MNALVNAIAIMVNTLMYWWTEDECDKDDTWNQG